MAKKQYDPPPKAGREVDPETVRAVRDLRSKAAPRPEDYTVFYPAEHEADT